MIIVYPNPPIKTRRATPKNKAENKTSSEVISPGVKPRAFSDDADKTITPPRQTGKASPYVAGEGNGLRFRIGDLSVGVKGMDESVCRQIVKL